MGAKSQHDGRKRVIADLRRQMQACRRHVGGAPVHGLFTDSVELEALFSNWGIRRGSLVEWVGDGPASGAGTVSLLVAQKVCTNDCPWVIVDTAKEVYPPALASLGFDLSSLLIVRPCKEEDVLWAYEQALRCEAVAGVWGRIEKLRPVAFRRLQLAAEESNAIGLLVRPQHSLAQPSWADVRLLVKARPGENASARFRIEVAYSRGQSRRSPVDVEIDELRGTLREVRQEDETSLVPVVAELANPATYGCQAGT